MKFSAFSPLSLLPAVIVVIMLTGLAACSSIDCPLNSLVYTQYQLMNAAGRVDTLADTLTISTKRTDGNYPKTWIIHLHGRVRSPI